MIQTEKAEHWVEWLEGLDEANIWQASRLVTSPATDAGKAKIPTLQVKDPTTKHVTREVVDNKSKGQLFYETFFPPPNPDLAPIPQDYNYPPPCWNFKNIMDEQVHHTTKKMKPYKASKKASVPNLVLIHAREELIPFLSLLYCATNTLKYYPQEWACTKTLIPKKPGKPDYTSPSAWCPIVLSDGMARLLNSCQAEDMTMMCEKYDILPANHFGARPGHTTTDSIHLLTKTIKDAWHKGQVASVLFLDVKGAFPSIDIDRLIHNMRKRGIPKEYMEWMKRRLENRQTMISFDDYQTEAFKVLNGLDQGDPYSGVSHLIYNADILKIPVLKAGEWILLFVDDAMIIVCGKNFNKTHEKLRNIMNCTGRVFKWAKTHNCKFGIEKFQLLDATKKWIPNPINPKERIPTPQQALVLGDKHIQSKDTARFLGVIVDNKLDWKAQCATVLARGQDWLIQFRRLACATHGINAKYMQQLYLSITVPRMLYAADIFLTPQQNAGKRAKYEHTNQAGINKLASIQRQAALMIMGAMKTTTIDVLEVMANLLPFHLLVEKH